MKVFISYAGPEEELARDLAARLGEAGYQVWPRRDDLLPGDNWHEKVGKALEESEAMVVLLSPEAVNSSWVRSEIDYALGSPNYEGRLIPVLVRPTQNIPWILQELPFLRAGKSRADISRRIVDQLQTAAG